MNANAPPNISRRALGQARSVIDDALADCGNDAERVEALIAHLSIAAGLLVHMVGLDRATAAVAGLLQAFVRMSS